MKVIKGRLFSLGKTYMGSTLFHGNLHGMVHSPFNKFFVSATFTKWSTHTRKATIEATFLAATNYNNEQHDPYQHSFAVVTDYYQSQQERYRYLLLKKSYFSLVW